MPNKQDPALADFQKLEENMATAKIKFSNPASVNELYADYIMVTDEGDNVCIKFYRQRPLMEGKYEMAEHGRIVSDDLPQEYEGVLQSSLVLPLHAAYYLLTALEDLGVKAQFWGHSRESV